MVTPDNPPGRPLAHRGKAPLRMMWEQGVSADAQVTVKRAIVSDDCAAITYHCEFPGKHSPSPTRSWTSSTS